MRFEVAHGQLEERELEKRMLNFLRGEADVLVCTSIIVAGIHIPQANSLIVERADVFVLAQLYQIRGRVGRSRERAYAYLLYPSSAALTSDAAQRPSALGDYTELGAGFKVAMRDLEIRGAGNLLGDEQSGHVAALGFELYMQMLDEAVRAAGPAAQDEELPEPVRLDVHVDAYVPADYVPSQEGGRGGRTGRAGRGAARARAPGRQRGCVRAGGLRSLRAGEDRDSPARGGGAGGGRPGARAGGAGGPLRPGARVARQPALLAARTHQVRPGRCAGCELPWHSPGGGADRAR